jgi:murein DD-endopeptidase MepM/ murein hydrolase activator NlpD
MLLAAALPIAVPLLLATASIESAAPPANKAAAIVTPGLRYADLAPLSPAELPEHSVVLTFERDDTLASILQAGRVALPDAAQLIHEFGKSIDFRRMRPGHLVRFHYDPEQKVDSVQLRLTGWGDLQATRGLDGSFVVTSRPLRPDAVITTVSATIKTSLYDALRESGEEPQLVQQLVDVFQWDIDFFALQKGDSFSLVVEKKYAGRDLVGYGPILAARFVQDGGNYEAFRYENADGRAGYYGHDAKPLRKQFLRAPLKFTRITSGFSKKRFHPVLRYFRPHYGVDYGAPAGTPVMTTADGVVVEARRSRGEGNFVRIRHTSRIETYYLHLSRFAKGIRRGTRVTQGDVIGYVGATGLATAPHLDYRVKDGGKWLDPLKLKSITPDRLHGESLRRFRADVARLLPQLSFAPQEIAADFSKRRALF